MKGCISAQTLMVHRFVMFSVLSSVMIGFVCVRGGTFFTSRMSLFCIILSGFMYVLRVSSVPHIGIAPMRCG